MEQPKRNATTASQTSGLRKRKKPTPKNPERKLRRSQKGECNTVYVPIPNLSVTLSIEPVLIKKPD